MAGKIKLALIYGSTREGRLCDSVAAWTTSRIERDKRYAVDVVDPSALDFSNRLDGEGREVLDEVGARLASADAFIVVTPEYNHSYPAPLKALIDAFGPEWHAKPVGFVSYGGISGGLRAVEHLRGVFAELHAVGIRDTVSFAGAWKRFGPDGLLRDPADAERSMATMLSRLHWWASALAAARDNREFGEAA